MTNKRFYLDERFRAMRRSLKKYYRISRGQRYFVTQLSGQQLLLDSRNSVDRNVDTFGSYEAEQIRYLIALVRQYQCTRFIDIGALWGLYSLQLSAEKFTQPLTVIAFEPDKINRYQLYANLFMNRLENVTVHDCGLSDRSGVSRFMRNKGNNRGANQIHEHGEYEIEIHRGDDLLQFAGEKIALKIDVEGHELKVLRGLQELLSRNQCVLQIESFDSTAAELAPAVGSEYRHLHSIDSDHYFTNFS